MMNGTVKKLLRWTAIPAMLVLLLTVSAFAEEEPTPTPTPIPITASESEPSFTFTVPTMGTDESLKEVGFVWKDSAVTEKSTLESTFVRDGANLNQWKSSSTEGITAGTTNLKLTLNFKSTATSGEPTPVYVRGYVKTGDADTAITYTELYKITFSFTDSQLKWTPAKVS